LSLRVRDIAAIMEELAPRRLALDWDNVGLQVGRPDASVTNLLVCLDYNQAVLQEALALKANFILCHHPVIMKPLYSLRTDLAPGALLRETLARDLQVFAAHTNLDAAAEGVNHHLARAFSLENVEVLQKTGEDPLLKLAVFVPPSHEDAVREALAGAGAGWIGAYSHCTFASPGTGTFMPREGTNPFIGRRGNLEKVEELRLETILPASLRERVLKALLAAHPYEEAAYDLYPLALEGRAAGLGCVGDLPAPLTLKELALQARETLGVDRLKVAGEENRLVARMAVCGGSGGDLVSPAAAAGAHVLLTGDVKYHQAREAGDLALALIDAGHDATERVILEPLAARLQEKITGLGHTNRVFPSGTDTSCWKFI
jgi:dinuclear metal center YbgI/SA1388 family protein